MRVLRGTRDPMKPYILCVDGEANSVDGCVCADGKPNSLHGEVFAVGAVVLDLTGNLVATFAGRYELAAPDKWIVDNVLPHIGDVPVYPTPRAMRDAFWAWVQPRFADATVLAHCGWPVEANLFQACVADDSTRAFQGPYPLHDVATLLLAVGIDPLGSYAAEVMRGRPGAPHDPRYDAEASARLALRCLNSLH